MTTHPPTTTLPPVGSISTTTRIAAQCPETKRWYTVESVVTVPIGADQAEIAEAMTTTARVQTVQDALLQRILDAYLDGPPAAIDAPAPAPAAAPVAPPTPPAEVTIHVGRFTGWKLGTCTDTALTTISKGARPTFGQDDRDEALKKAALQLLNDRAQAAAREKHPTPAAAAPASRSAAPAPARPAAPSPAPHRADSRPPVRPLGDWEARMSTPPPEQPAYVLATIPRYPEGDERSEWFPRTYVRCGDPTPAGTPVLAGGRTILVVTDANAAQQLCRLLNRAGNFLAHGQLDNGDRAFSIGIDAAYQLEDHFHAMGIVLAATPLM